MGHKNDDGHIYFTEFHLAALLDWHFDRLVALFEQLQLATVDACDPSADLLTFADRATLFAIVMLGKPSQDQQASGGTDHPVSSQSFADPSGSRSSGGNGKQTTGHPIGIVYLTPASSPNDLLHAKELNIGILLDPSYEGTGYAKRSIEYALDHAFSIQNCHRVQAILPDHTAKDRAICFFTKMRFAHEGVRRLGFFSPLENTYKDVTYMAMLNTDWLVLRHYPDKQPAPCSVWDEMFTRHQREREELLRWESRLPLPLRLRPDQVTVTDGIVKEEGELDSELSPSLWCTLQLAPERFSESEFQSDDCSSPLSTRSLTPMHSEDDSSSWDLLEDPPSPPYSTL